MAAERAFGDAFGAGFLPFLDSGALADVTVALPGGRTFRLHSLLLAYHSAFFHRAFASEFVEGKDKRMHLELEPHLLPFFPDLLRYIYSDQTTLELDNVFGILALARQLLVAKLEAFCRAFVREQLSIDNCIHLLFCAVKYSDDELINECLHLAATEFRYTCRESMAGLPPDIVIQLLEHPVRLQPARWRRKPFLARGVLDDDESGSRRDHAGVLRVIEDSPKLEVQCEAQVLELVLNYIKSTDIDEVVTRRLLEQVRWPYLSNARLTDLETETPAVRPLLGAAALARLRCQSAAAAYETSAAEGACFPASPRQWEHSPQPAASVPSPQSDRSVSDEGVARKCDGRGGWEDAVGCWAGTSTWVPPLQPAPRPSYCSSLEWHLPGGCEHVDLPCHHIWSLLQPLLTVQVSGVQSSVVGVLEGRPKNVLYSGPDAFFSTAETPHPPPWVEIHLPANCRLLNLKHISFSHGHHRPSFYRVRNLKAQAGAVSCVRPGAAFTDLPMKLHTAASGREYRLAVHGGHAGHGLEKWRVVRLVGTGMQQDGVYRTLAVYMSARACSLFSLVLSLTTRLCIKSLKLYGTVRVDLMHQRGGLALTLADIARALQAAPADPPPVDGAHIPAMTASPPISPPRIYPFPPINHSLYNNQPYWDL